MDNGKLVGTEKIDVNVYEYEGVNFIEYLSPDYYRDNDETEYMGTCRWGYDESGKITGNRQILGSNQGICDVDLSGIDDAIYFEGKLYFKNKKTIRKYVESKVEIGYTNIVHIKVMGGK